MMKRISYILLILFALSCCLLSGCRQEETSSIEEAPSEAPTETQNSVVAGWNTIDGRRYYLLPDGSTFSGWLILEDGRYYLGEDTAAVTGRATIDGREYCFDSDGRMRTGIVTLDGHMYLFGADGSLAGPGWAQWDGSTYYVIEDGTVYTGWLQLGEYSYYLRSDGTMAVGRTEIGSEVYYFTPDGIHLTLVNPWHFLPEGYTAELTDVRGYQIDARCAQALEQMLSDCEKAGNKPQICSAYRSQATQEKLFNRKVRSYTSKGYSEDEAKELAGTEVAVPGTSEHQLGLAVDIVDDSNWNLDETQAKTPTQLWLMEHCWEYGFILRYPNEKSAITGIIYEPWHYRYVGTDISMALKDSDLCLEEYLDAVIE